MLILNPLTKEILKTFVVIICFIVYKLSKFYIKVLSLPPGPIPLPLIGNLLYFRSSKEHWVTIIERAADKYGPVFTIWIYSTPLVLISDIDIGREAFRKTELAGRPRHKLSKFLSNEEHTDVVLADYGPRWEALRRVAHSAVLKYSTTDKLVYLVSDCVDHTIKTIVEKEGLQAMFDPADYIYNIFLTILTTSAFGKRYELDDPEYRTFRWIQKEVLEENDIKLLIWEMFPILTKTDQKFKKIMTRFNKVLNLIKNKYKSHYKDYDESVIRDFCDTLITAKNDALRESKESAPYLTDKNLSLAIVDLFISGTDTSVRTFTWIVFLMTYYPEVLQKLRQEIECKIGDRIPTHEDRDRCHYTMAVISETLRLRNVVPNGFSHKAVVSCKIGDYTIPKDTQVSVLQGYILHNEKHWKNAQEFRPERFLENGKYITTRNKAFIPFGIGRRVCLGEKLALTDLFLVLVRFIQVTSQYDIKLHFDGNSEPDPKSPLGIMPGAFKISLNK